jgi:N-acyl-L-homoserine lactone synthetase
MLTILTGTTRQLQTHVETDLAAYRYKVFVEHLGWDLPIAEQGLERDQFDRPDTIYIVARKPDGSICGCARLLPTEQAYLLSTIFPGLLGNQAPPRAPDIWELSRYTTQVVGDDAASPEQAKERFRLLLKAVVEAALANGARRLISFGFVGVERLARSFGIHVHRAGAPQAVAGKAVVAFWVELDEQTRAALGIVANGARNTH